MEVCDGMSTTAQAMTQRVSAERLLAHLKWFAEVRRDTGGPGEAKAADYIAEQLRAAGVPAQVHEFDAYLSYPRQATLEVVEPARMPLPCLTHSFGRATGPDGRRPVFGTYDAFQSDPHWRDYILFHEYFHGDTGAGLGASHQTGWTALVAKLLEQTGGR